MSVPALRFQEFGEEWDKTTIGGLGKIVTGSTPSPSVSAYYGGKIPFFSPSDVPESGGLTSFSQKTLTNLGFAQTRRVPALSTLFVCIGSTIGKVGMTVLESGTNQQINAVIPGSKSDPHFVHFALVRAAPKIRKLTAVQAVPIVNKSTFQKAKIRRPTLPEQKKIAAFLGAVDARIAGARRRRDLLETYKRGLMQALFSRTLRFTRDDGTAFPDWEEKRLGGVFDWVKTNSLSREFLSDEAGYAQNIHYGDIHKKFRPLFRQDAEQVPYAVLLPSDKPFSDEEYCIAGDVVIADASEDYADIGKVIEIIQVREKTLVAGLHTYIARPRNGQTVVGFSGYLMRSASVRRQIMRIAQGISVLGISKTNLAKLDLLLPHPDEQKKIADALSAIDAKIETVAGQVAQLETFKKGLLQQMFV